MQPEPTPSKKPKSEKRRRNHKIEVRVDSSEFKLISELASDCGLKNPAYLRTLGLGYEPKSVVDQKVFLEVLRLHADMNRVAGLIKLWLSERDTKLPASLGIRAGELREAVASILEISDEIKATAKRL